MDTVEIKKMNTVERLQAMEMLWDALLHEEVEVKSPGWHQGIIKERIAKIDSGDAKFLSLQNSLTGKNGRIAFTLLCLSIMPGK